MLRAAGDTAGADAEATRAVEACEAKGATVLAERARATLKQPTQATEPVLAVDSVVPEQLVTTATAFHDRFVAAWDAHDWDRLAALFAPTWRISDRRAAGSGDLSVEESFASLRFLFDSVGPSMRWTVGEYVATRGDRILLARRNVQTFSRDGTLLSEAHALSLWRVDEQGRRDLSVDFDEDDLDAAFDELDRLYIEGEGAPYRTYWTRHCALTARHQCRRPRNGPGLLCTRLPLLQPRDPRMG